MSEKTETVRKIYVLPKDLVDRVSDFQTSRRLPSEVEAVRRLLYEALAYRDTPETIYRRFYDRMQSLGLPSEVAKEVLVGHPLVRAIEFTGQDGVAFSLTEGPRYQIDKDGFFYEEEGYNHWRMRSDSIPDTGF